MARSEERQLYRITQQELLYLSEVELVWRSVKIMKILLLIFTLCLISDVGASEEVTGYIGGGVLINCKYDTEYIKNTKSFCKVASLVCSDQIKTEAKNMWVTSGRFSVFDDTKSAEFWVMIRELTVEDTGTYRCGDYPSAWMKMYTQVELKIKKGSSKSREVTAYAGTRSNIKCRYEDQYKNKPKSFWKIRTDQWSIKHIKTEPHSEWSHDGRFSIHDNRSAGFFSVFIRELIIEDTGTYACAVAASDRIEIYTVVQLNVTEDVSFEKTLSVTAHVGEDVTIRCTYPESHRNDDKFLCKRPKTSACLYTATIKESKKYRSVGKFSLYDDREKHVFTVSLKDVTKQDSGEYWCGAEVAWKKDHGYKVYFTHVNLTVTGFLAIRLTVLCVGLLVLLIGIIFVIVILYKRCKIQDRETMTQTSSKKNEDYEDMHRLQSAQNTNPTESVYYSLNPNTNQSDSVYQSLNPNTNQSDSVYQSLNPNTNQSDSVYQSLNPNQSDSVYQSLNPNQSD
ncbi:polymeric immunoglobulin receptor-like isoform X2 [Silurus meridionalis]|uniref:polymeric immunoglobulin receptor-like isoform X2 n=1 Tax=Silurus meridionalis TaxID=175797 RepID=UPI001EEA9A97|nr:polymeric immunoglobulin receptor-like isoform X2 [Silurus meridionalis]